MAIAVFGYKEFQRPGSGACYFFGVPKEDALDREERTRACAAEVAQDHA